jgi:hypothetical protein
MWAIVYTRSIGAYYILAPSHCNIHSRHVEILKSVHNSWQLHLTVIIFICICTHKCMLLIDCTYNRITHYWYDEVSMFWHISILNAGRSDYCQVINSNNLTPWSRVLIEKLISCQVAKIFLAFVEPALSLMNPVYAPPANFLYIQFNIIMPSMTSSLK